MLRISRPADKLLASREGLCSMELVNQVIMVSKYILCCYVLWPTTEPSDGPSGNETSHFVRSGTVARNCSGGEQHVDEVGGWG